MKIHSEKCEAHPNHKNFEALESECTCDGYHTFGELYEHRHALWIALCSMSCFFGCAGEVWRSKRHSDGELAFGGGWFILGIGKQKGEQITYHLPMSKWDECEFAETLEKAPEWDEHTSDDVLELLKNYKIIGFL